MGLTHSGNPFREAEVIEEYDRIAEAMRLWEEFIAWKEVEELRRKLRVEINVKVPDVQMKREPRLLEEVKRLRRIEREADHFSDIFAEFWDVDEGMATIYEAVDELDRVLYGEHGRASKYGVGGDGHHCR